VEGEAYSSGVGGNYRTGVEGEAYSSGVGGAHRTGIVIHLLHWGIIYFTSVNPVRKKKK